MTHQLAVNLAQKGDLVYIATCRERNLPITELRDKNYCVYRLPRLKIPIIGSLLYFFSVFCLAVQLKPDIVLDQGLLGCGLLVRVIMKKPYIVWGQGSDVYGVKTPVQRIFVKFILKTASLVLALSKNMKEAMRQITNREIIVLPNGVYISKFQRAMVKTPEKRFGRKQLLFVGNIRPVKGVEYLLNAMSIIVKEEPDAYLVLVGSYPSTFVQKIPKDLKNKVLLTGFVNHKEIPAYMKGSYLFILPSLSEGLPNVLLEAMVAGLPIVATNVGGIPEIVRNGENGFLVRPKDSRALAEKVLLLLKNKSLREHISRNNRLKVRNYDISKIFSKLERLMQCVR